MSQGASHHCPRCGDSLANQAIDGLCPRCLAAINFATDTLAPEGWSETQVEPLAAAKVAEHFPNLEVIELLGRGGMGVVYKARQRALGRLVALKLMAPECAAEPKFAERFVQEAQALAALNHPNIVTIHDFGQAGSFYYVLMEFVDGVNLRQAMTAGRFTPEQALVMVPPICEALQYAHDHKIVHRDIKPENLLLDKQGRVKIADFGIAKILGRESSDLGVVESQPAGTPRYMAPEQLTRHVADHRSDIYSLGVVLYEMLTGELPGPKLQPPSKRVQVDAGIDSIVLRALEKSPELRFDTATEFRTQVENWIHRQESPAEQSGLRTAAVEARAVATGRAARSFGKLGSVGAVMVGVAMASTMIVVGLKRGHHEQVGNRLAIEADRQKDSTSEGAIENALAPADSIPPGSFFEVREGKLLALVEQLTSRSATDQAVGRLRIRVPAGNHDLSPFRGLTAPRLLTKVSGDFTVQVKVTGDFKPGLKTMGKGHPFQAAGILIWQDNDNFLRVERNAWRQGDSFWCYPPLIEYWRDHEYAGMNVPAVSAQFFTGESTWLKAVRGGSQIMVSVSHDGEKWNDVRSFAVELAAEVRVGVAALNTSDEPFVADFEDLTITRDGAASTVFFKDSRNNGDLVEVTGIVGGADRVSVLLEPTSKFGGEPNAKVEGNRPSN
ncbi:MAG: protein kinase [Planctomycetes bacterium]|nr:protein kinase [Planctomycetota bacterium]